jgi:hypothetical protein
LKAVFPALGRRFLVLVALFFWQGGFTFYTAVVVPVGTDVLGSSRRQGFITRQVTKYLNVAGAVALGVLAFDMACARDKRKFRRLARWGLWFGLVATLIALFALHHRLDQLLATRGGIVRDPELFEPLHRVYLWVSTVQWAAGMGFLFVTLDSWRAEDVKDNFVEK